MKPSFIQLRRYLSHPQVKELISLYNKLFDGNYDTHHVWQYNYYELADIIDVLNYRGELTYRSLQRFMNTKQQQRKKQQKQKDDELFKNIASMKKQHQQNKQQKWKPTQLVN